MASRLEIAANNFILHVGGVDHRQWSVVPQPGVWSIGKEIEHVAEAAAYHHWIVRLTIGEDVPPRRPVLERTRMTSTLTPSQAVELVRTRTVDGLRLLHALTDEQLDLPTRPSRANGQVLAATIERVLIGHYEAHRVDIAAKLQALG